MEKLKEFWKKLNPRVALIGGVVVISTSLGTCHFMEPNEAAQEEAPAEAPADEGEVEADPAPPAEEAPVDDGSEDEDA